MSDSELRDRLLELERITPELEAKYRDKMKSVYERPLTPVSRIANIVAMLMGIGFFLLFSTVAVMVWGEPDFPVIGRLMFAFGALFGLAFAVFYAVILRKGSIDLTGWRNVTMKQFRTMHPAVFGLTWAFLVLMTVACQMMGSQMADTARGNQMILGSIVYLVLFGIPLMVLSSATESELLVREKFLQVELQLAELKRLLTAEKQGSASESSEEE